MFGLPVWEERVRERESHSVNTSQETQTSTVSSHNEARLVEQRLVDLVGPSQSVVQARDTSVWNCSRIGRTGTSFYILIPGAMDESQ